MDIRLVAAVITRVTRNTFTEQLFDSRDEGLVPWKWQSGERDIGSLQAAGQRRGIVSLRQRDSLQLNT